MNSELTAASYTAGLIVAEYLDAKKMHPTGMRSAHEGYAIILEELDELWDEVKKKQPDREKMVKEAKQVAAMALRFMLEIG